jgi:hypothetical protein
VGLRDSIRSREQSAGFGSAVVRGDIGPFMTQQISPVLQVNSGCSQPTAERVPEIMYPNVAKASWRFDAEALSVTLRGEPSSPEPPGRTQMSHWCAATRRYENESTMATPNAFEDRLGSVIDNDQT